MKNESHDKWNFSNYLEAQDGPHIRIKPVKHKSSFFSYKHCFSVVFRASADAIKEVDPFTYWTTAIPRLR